MNAVRESPTTVFRRCLALLRQLQRGPATKAELIATVHAAIEEPYGGAEGPALDKRFERDKRKLREIFAVDLRYRRATQTYEIVNTWVPLLDLPDRALEAIAFLQKTFEPDTPNYDIVQEFLGLLIGYLSPERRGDLDRKRIDLDVKWGQRDEDTIDPGVEAGLCKALIERRWIAFDYHSPSQADEKPRHHLVQPWERYFDSVRGHYYLRGYCKETTSEAYGQRSQNRYFHYRLGRISNLEVLPNKLPPSPPRIRPRSLVYRLAPSIARRGDVSRHPGITILEEKPQEDGSIIVHAETENVWWAVRSLLHYGANCQILEGPEARYEMEKVVRAMTDMYT